MNQRHLLTILAALLCAFSYADTEQVVTIDNDTMDGFVTQITFSGDDVILSFEDGFSVTSDMANVSITLSYGGETGINSISFDEVDTHTVVYNLMGQFFGTSTDGLQRGVYIINGKKTIVR